MGTRVYIGRLPYRCSERDIDRFFRGYGRIREIMLKNGYGFVEFDDHRDADDAVYELNGRDLLGERILLEHARGPARRRGDDYGRDRGYRDRPQWLEKYGAPVRTSYRLIVENLSTRVSWQDLKDYMRQAGDVTYADAHKTRRNEGVVEFASSSDLKRAVEKLDDTEINGRRIKLIVDRDKDSYSRSRSRSQSRSHGRSRSRSRSRSKSRSKSHSKTRSKSQSRSYSRSRSRSQSRSHSRSATPNNDHKGSRHSDSDQD